MLPNWKKDHTVSRHMRLSHTAARKYAFIMSIRLLAATGPDHGKLTKMLCICKSGVQCHHIYKGVTACQRRDSSTTRKDRNDDFATVCASLANPDRARKSEQGSGLKPISGFVSAAKYCSSNLIGE